MCGHEAFCLTEQFNSGDLMVTPHTGSLRWTSASPHHVHSDKLAAQLLAAANLKSIVGLRQPASPAAALLLLGPECRMPSAHH